MGPGMRQVFGEQGSVFCRGAVGALPLGDLRVCDLHSGAGNGGGKCGKMACRCARGAQVASWRGATRLLSSRLSSVFQGGCQKGGECYSGGVRPVILPGIHPPVCAALLCLNSTVPRASL